MAKPNKRKAKEDTKMECEYSAGMVTFGRNSERRRHSKGRHSPLIQCCVPGCKWTTKRMGIRSMGRLRTHLDNAHRGKASTNRTLQSEFRTATAQSLSSSSNHFSTPDANIDSNFPPTPPLIYIDYAFQPQARHNQPDASESYAAFNSKEALHPEYYPMLGSSLASRTRAQGVPPRVFRPCRIRRRASHTTALTSSAGPPLNQLSSAMESTLHFYSNGQDNSTASTQWMADPLSVELMAGLLRSLSLDYSNS